MSLTLDQWIGLLTFVAAAIGGAWGLLRKFIIAPSRRFETKLDGFHAKMDAQSREVHEEIAPNLRAMRRDVIRIGEAGRLAHKRIDHLLAAHNDLRVFVASATKCPDVPGGNPLMRSGKFELDEELMARIEQAEAERKASAESDETDSTGEEPA